MRVFRPEYQAADGQWRKVKRWWVILPDHKSCRRKFPGFTSKSQTEALGRQIEHLASCRKGNLSLPPELQRWLREAPKDLLERLARFGLIEPRQVAAGKPLVDLVEDWVASLRGKNREEKHVKQARNDLLQILEACRWAYFSDINAGQLEAYLLDLHDRGRGISARTYNSKLKFAQQFCRWLLRNGLVNESPLTVLSGLNVETDRRRVRRAIDDEQLMHLLATTDAGPERFGMTGHERALVYRLCAESGLRANEVRTLTVASFDWEAGTVRVKAHYSKRRKNDELSLHPDTVEDLKAYMANKLPTCPAFNVPNRTADMIQADLADAGIPYCEGDEFFDFHALRYETGTRLIESGADPKVVQEHMRHSDIKLTLGLYSKVRKDREKKAVANVPSLRIAKPPKGQAEGA